MYKLTTSYEIYVSLYVEVWIWVLSVICPTTAWAGTLGYTAGSTLSHTTHTHNGHTYIHTHKHTHTLKESFIWGLELSYNVRTAPKIHLPTQIHTSERRGTSPLTVPVSTMPKSTTLSLSLHPSSSVCNAYKEDDTTVPCIHRGRQTFSLNSLSCLTPV